MPGGYGASSLRRRVVLLASFQIWSHDQFRVIFPTFKYTIYIVGSIYRSLLYLTWQPEDKNHCNNKAILIKGLLVKAVALSNGDHRLLTTRRCLLPAAVFGMPTSQILNYWEAFRIKTKKPHMMKCFLVFLNEVYDGFKFFGQYNPEAPSEILGLIILMILWTPGLDSDEDWQYTFGSHFRWTLSFTVQTWIWYKHQRLTNIYMHYNYIYIYIFLEIIYIYKIYI